MRLTKPTTEEGQLLERIDTELKCLKMGRIYTDILISVLEDCKEYIADKKTSNDTD